MRLLDCIVAAHAGCMNWAAAVMQHMKLWSSTNHHGASQPMVSAEREATVSHSTPERQQRLVPQLLAHPQLVCCNVLLETALHVTLVSKPLLNQLLGRLLLLKLLNFYASDASSK